MSGRRRRNACGGKCFNLVKRTERTSRLEEGWVRGEKKGARREQWTRCQGLTKHIKGKWRPGGSRSEGRKGGVVRGRSGGNRG